MRQTGAVWSGEEGVGIQVCKTNKTSENGRQVVSGVDGVDGDQGIEFYKVIGEL